MELELNTTRKFYKYWFNQLISIDNRNKTKIDVFNDVNNLYSYIYRTKKGKFDNFKSFIKELKLLHIDPVQFN